MSVAQSKRIEQRTHPDAPEQRTVDVDVEGLNVKGRTVSGYAAVYGTESRDLGGYRERIAAGAFDNVLAGDDVDVRCLLNHDPNIVLGRTKSGTLKLSSDSRGLKFECELPETRSDLREAVERRDLDGASFRFVVDEEEWQGDELRTVKTIKELHDVTLATYPAYPSASVELRTRPEPKPGDRPANGGGLVIRDRLRPEDRTGDGGSDVERRVVEAIQSVRKGETRSIGVGDAEAITPPELSSYLFEALRPSSVALLSGVLTIPTDKAEVIWPKLSTAVDPSWIAAGTEIPQGDPTITKLTNKPKKLAHLIQIENEVIDDSEPSVIDVLNNHLALMLALKLDFTVFEGDSSIEKDGPDGMANIAGIQHGKKPTKYDPFIEAVGALQDANAPGPYVAVGPPSVFTALALMKNKNEDQLAAPKEMPKVFTSTQLTRTFVYAPSQVVITPRQDATIEVDRSRLFHRDESEMRGKLRADILLPNPEAIILLDE